MEQRDLRMGIDIGSTTVKIVIVDIKSGKTIFSIYKRHNARQVETILHLLKEIESVYKEELFRIAICGSGGKPVADGLQVPFIQEVVANSAAIQMLYPKVRTAIELGGQDAKVIFFSYDEALNRLIANDMRMNGSCAGGTGAFIDEIATLLKIETDEFEEIASKGTEVYDISGRCGVFAKTDIQPLLIQGATRENIALSTFHAIAKQTIGGLSQGLELKPPIIFEGGPLTFNPTLVKVFAQRLNLKEEDIIIPEHPETIVAFGTAIAMNQIFPAGTTGTDMLTISEAIKRLSHNVLNRTTEYESKEEKFFQNEEELKEFSKRHNDELLTDINTDDSKKILLTYLGIDSGSTTSKFVLLNEKEEVIERFYANNQGVPLKVVKEGLISVYEKYKKAGIQLKIMGFGTTGYGEKLMAEAFGADYHTVETVAHAEGCKHYIPDATFLLDIGGQDMKAIWLNNGVITNIMLNEACSSGCGSFLENFAKTLGIPVEEIADTAFSAKNPAKLGSRCTVFMNSTIINEQRDGKAEDDIMAGLCRSIIENVFTKVVRVSNTDELGDKIVVQGGTFRNFAVLRALEEYLGKEVILAPYPGEMGAIGAALLAKRYMETNSNSSSFIGFDKISEFNYTTEAGVKCEHCENHCSRTIMTFSTGNKWITGNRCENGGVLVENNKSENKKSVPDLFIERNRMLLKEYKYKPVSEKKDETIGIPCVLEFWDSMPFWTTLFKALGFNVKLSHPSSRNLYEQGIQYVASDTICFPAKLVHGHIIDLAEQKVDRIFMPYIMHMPPEGKDKLSPYVCSVVMGYPMVVRNSQSPEKQYNLKFDTPIFHWFTKKDRKKQICEFIKNEFGVTLRIAEEAFLQAETALKSFRAELVKRGNEIISEVKENDGFAVVLAGRPYHTDSFISHNISKFFTKQGIPVLTVDSLEELNKVDLSHTRAEITNNFHTRMLAGAYIAAERKELEYAQIVSFGCGHDAILSDEIVRVMKEISNKPPLILKVDESDATGSIGIRVESFIESIKIRRKLNSKDEKTNILATAYNTKFYKKDKKNRTLLIPNISDEVSILLRGILEKEGFLVKPISVGGISQIKIGKKYSHNDICFPCQMVIGELIDELQKGGYNQDEVAVGMVKFQCDCRMSHYAALLRKALDSAGFCDVPVLTTDVNDTKNMHPGVFLLGIGAVIEAVWTFMMVDILKDLSRKIRPYELNKGETDKVLSECVTNIANAIKKGMNEAKEVFSESIDKFSKIQYNREVKKPRVLVTGELLVTYHPGSNFDIEKYLEKNGMETIFPRVTDQLRKDFLATMAEIKDYKANIPPYPFIIDYLFDSIQRKLEEIAIKHPLYEKTLRPRDIYKEVKDIIPETLSCGEGWLMAAEIAHFAKEGVKSFVILQPFGCLPNHICGRGVIKRLKDDFPLIQILPLDLDPDTSFANVENRLQMLIMNANF